jgi:hypothetical protein
VGPRAVLDAVVKRKMPSPPPPAGLEPKNPDRPARSLVAIPTELSRLFGTHCAISFMYKLVSVRHVDIHISSATVKVYGLL